MFSRLARRKAANAVFVGFCTLAATLAILTLAAILVTLVGKGLAGLDLDVFTKDTPAAQSVGGLRNAIVGTILMCVAGMVVAVFIGVLAGTWLAEYSGRNGYLRSYASVVRFVNDVLLSAPSILIGLFVYEVMVKNLIGHFSGWAGAVALAFLAIPVVVRTTEDVLRLQAKQLRESGIALGATMWTTIQAILWKAAGGGIITGLLLAFARISGETAPLLFTALGNLNFSLDMNQPMANLPKVIFDFALSADDNWRRLAWVASLLIAFAVLGINILVRVISQEQRRS